MRILLTQAAEDSEAAGQALTARGHEVVSCPLLRIEFLTAAPAFSGAQGFLVSGAAAARALAGAVGVRTFPAFADSPVTADVLTRAGFRHVEAVHGDPQDLARLVSSRVVPTAGALIHACTTTQPPNLAAMLGTMGFSVRPLPLVALTRIDHLPETVRRGIETGGIDAAVFTGADEARAFATIVQRDKLEVAQLAVVAATPVVAAPLRSLAVRTITVPPMGDAATLVATFDAPLVDRVAEERERLKREQSERQAREQRERNEREKQAAREQREREEKAAREQGERERAQQERRETEERRRREEQAARETQRLDKEKEQAVKTEQERLRREAAEQKRQAREQREREEQATREQHERDKAEQARRQAEERRQREEQAARLEKDRIAREAQQRQRSEQAALDQQERDQAARDRQQATERRAAEDKVERERREMIAVEQRDRASLVEQAQRAQEEQASRQQRIAQEQLDLAERARRVEKTAREQHEREEEARKEAARKQEEERRRAVEEEARRQQQAAEEEHLRRERDARERAEAERRAREKTDKEKAEQAAREALKRKHEQAARDQQAREDAARAAHAEATAAAARERQDRQAAKEQARVEETERKRLLQEDRAREKAAQRKEQARQDEIRRAEREQQKRTVEEDRARRAAEQQIQTQESAGNRNGEARSPVRRFFSWFARSTPVAIGPISTGLSSGMDSGIAIHRETERAMDLPASSAALIVERPTTAELNVAPDPGSAKLREPRPEPPPRPTEPFPRPPEKPPMDPTPPMDAETTETPRAPTGRAARLMAEDAADERSRESRWRSYAAESTEDASAEPLEPITPQRSGSRRVLVFVVVLAILVATVLASAGWWVPRVSTAFHAIPGVFAARTPAPAADLAALTARVGALEQQAPEATAALRKDMDQRLAARAGGNDTEAITSLGGSIAAQAGQLAALTARIATLEAALGNAQQLDELNKRMGTLEARSADAASVLALSDRVGELEKTTRNAIADQTLHVGLLLAVAQWREALATGRPFALELATVKTLAGRAQSTAGFTVDDARFGSMAAAGITTSAELQAQFDDTAARVTRAAIIPDATTGWLRRTLDRLLSVVTVRRVDGLVEGNGPSGVLARAETYLNHGNLAAAVTEMEALTGPAAMAAAPWMDEARARVAAEAAVADASTKALAGLGPASP